MKLSTGQTGNDTVFGLVTDGHVHDLRSGFADMVTLLRTSRSPEGRDEIARHAAHAPAVSLDAVQLLPPVPQPRRILCVGTNYHDHVAESDRVVDPPTHPMVFTRFPSSFIGHGEALVRPAVSTNFDYEGELAVIIGDVVRNADADTALSAVAGYSCLMDGTLRDFQRHTSQFTAGKNFDRSGSWGPWIVTADAVADPTDLKLETLLDGEVLQSASTAQLIFDIADIIAYCSSFTTLEPGDVIATGTPGGVGYAREPQRWLTPGSEITVRVSGVGELSNSIIDEKDLT